MTAVSAVRNGEQITIVSPAARRGLAEDRDRLRQAEELIEPQAELEAAGDLTVSESGAVVSVDDIGIVPLSGGL